MFKDFQVATQKLEKDLSSEKGHISKFQELKINF